MTYALKAEVDVTTLAGTEPGVIVGRCYGGGWYDVMVGYGRVIPDVPADAISERRAVRVMRGRANG